jgi:hypothetical protein
VRGEYQLENYEIVRGEYQLKNSEKVRGEYQLKIEKKCVENISWRRKIVKVLIVDPSSFSSPFTDRYRDFQNF